MVLDKIRAEYYANPNQNKPLKICHGFPYNSSMPIIQKMNVISAKLKEHADNGYGGIVTNVSFHNYLCDEEEWQLFRHTLQCCCDMGLRVWLYDEKAYPSGSAGGLTLEEHPEYQAQAIGIKTTTSAPGEKIIIEFPRGHNYVVGAYTYRSDGLHSIKDSDIMSPYKSYDHLKGTQNGISDINETNDKLTTVYFVRKYMYEGTHAVHNVAESRRYIDVSNRDAVSAFIDNTYKKYAYYIKDCENIEAIFTDEPSYMGAYINANLFPSAVRDEFDETIEFLPVINWGANAENCFKSMYGYDIIPRLAYLFTGKSKLAKKTRLDFYEMMTTLYEESYFKQISDYCSGINIAFSGHVLLEDDIRYHTVFEGNMFSLLRHMHYPGIDMLNGTPERIRADAFTPKLISSIAHTYNRPHVMSEVSAHAQGGMVTPEQMLGTVTAQYALGVDIFTSYFGDNALPVDKYREWNDTIGRIDKIMGGGKHISHIAVYYPIETMQANYIPFGKQIYEEINLIQENTACRNSLHEILDLLLNNQLDFDFLDMYSIKRADVSGNKLHTAGGEAYKTLILPACYVTDEIEVLVRRLIAGGITVIALRDEIFTEDSDILGACGVVIAENNDMVIDLVKEHVLPDLSLINYQPELIYLLRKNENGKNMLIVNASDRVIKTKAKASCFTGCVTIYDPQSDTVTGSAEADCFDIELGPYKSLIIFQEEKTN